MKAPIQLLFLMTLFPFLQGCLNSGGLKLRWHVPIASEIPPIVANGTVYVHGFHAGHPDEPYRLFALDALTGTERWVSADSVEEVYGESGGFVFFLNEAKNLVQLDARSGEKIYESNDSSRLILNWVIQGDVMFIVNASKEVSAVDNRLSKVLWRRKLPFNPGDDTDLQLAGQNIVVSGNYRNAADQYGAIWALDAATGNELWHFEAPLPHDYAPLKVLTHETFVLATNTAPTVLTTHVLDLNTGKELYPPIGIFDVYGFQADTVYSPSGAFNLKTGQRIGGQAKWVSGSVIHQGIAWHRQLGSVGAWRAFRLRNTYDGDFRGNRNWTDTPPNSWLEGFELTTGKSIFKTKECQYTRFSNPVKSDGLLFHTSIALMKEGKSGVWAYQLPKAK